MGLQMSNIIKTFDPNFDPTAETERKESTELKITNENQVQLTTKVDNSNIIKDIPLNLQNENCVMEHDIYKNNNYIILDHGKNYICPACSVCSTCPSCPTCPTCPTCPPCSNPINTIPPIKKTSLETLTPTITPNPTSKQKKESKENFKSECYYSNSLLYYCSVILIILIIIFVLKNKFLI